MSNLILHFFSYLQISFVIPQDAIPGRMALLLISFLNLINLFIYITSNSPNIESLTNSITAWICACIFFVFSAIIEYGIILCYKYVFCSLSPFFVIPSIHDREFMLVDLICLAAVIISFVLFNLMFWTFKLW